MSRPLPAGASLADDDAARARFEAFARAGGDARARPCGANDENDDDDSEFGDASSSAPRFVASNVGALVTSSRDGEDGVRAFAVGDARRGTCVVSDGTGDAYAGRLAARDAEDADAEDASDVDAARARRILRAGETSSTVLIAMDEWSGEHCVMATIDRDDASRDAAWYRRAGWANARPIAGLRGVHCTSAAFARGASDDDVLALVGANDGRVFVVRIDQSGDARRFEKSCDEAFRAPDGDAVTGLCASETRVEGGETRYGVLIATPLKLYALAGSYSLESVLARARATPRGVEATVVTPAASATSALRVWRDPSDSRACTRMAWLTGAGVYRGTLNFASDDASGVLENHGALPPPPPPTEGDVPASLALTAHHVIVLYSTHLVAMNVVTGDVEATIELPRGGAGTFACTDPTTGRTYAANADNLLEVVVENEDARVWRVHCDQGDFDDAARACKTELQRQFVYTVEAERMIKMKRYERAAEAFARAGVAHAVETVAKTFVDLNARDALYAYVEGRLRGLPIDDAPRRLILATWLFEEYVKIASFAKSATNDARVRAFMRDHHDALDERETLRVLSDAKRLDDEMYFAELCGDYDRVLDHFLRAGDARRSVEVAFGSGVPRSTLNRVLPELVRASPRETIDAMLATETTADDIAIIDRVCRDDSPLEASTSEVFAHATRYLETITAAEGGDARGDGVAHDALLRLYVGQLDASPTVASTLSKYILDAVDEKTKTPYYDVHAAIRLCEKHGAHRSAAYAYCVARDYDMAMHVALSTLQDVELAKKVTQKAAESPSGDVNEDEIVQKKLWLEIAKWSIRKSGALDPARVESMNEEEKRVAIRDALSFLKGTNGALRIEDILPLLPDFTIIDDVKDLVLQSLTDHRNEIEELRQGLEKLTTFTQDVEDDIEDLEQKTIVISKDEKCAECRKPVVRLRLMESADDPKLLAPFYVFPCEMAYHTECLIRRVLPLMLIDDRRRALALMRTLKVPLPRQLKPETKYWGAPPKSAVGLTTEEAVAELEDLLCADCPDCGGLDYRIMNEPILTPEEQALDDEFAKNLPENWEQVIYEEIDCSAPPGSVIDIDDAPTLVRPRDWPDASYFTPGDC